MCEKGENCSEVATGHKKITDFFLLSSMKASYSQHSLAIHSISMVGYGWLVGSQAVSVILGKMTFAISLRFLFFFFFFSKQTDLGCFLNVLIKKYNSLSVSKLILMRRTLVNIALKR